MPSMLRWVACSLFARCLDACPSPARSQGVPVPWLILFPTKSADFAGPYNGTEAARPFPLPGLTGRMSGKGRPCYAGLLTHCSLAASTHALRRLARTGHPFPGCSFFQQTPRILRGPIMEPRQLACSRSGLTGRMSGCPCFAGAQRCCASLGNGLGRSVISPRQHSRAYARA